MSLPQHNNLPKPPPKALPSAHGPVAPPAAPPVAMAAARNLPPGRPTPALPPGRPAAPNIAPGRPAASAQSVPSVPNTPTTPAPAALTPVAQLVAAAGGLAKPAAAPRTMPKVDIRTLPPSVGPMVEAIHLYDALLTEENAALKAGDSKSVEALLDRKMAATRLYQDRLRTLLADPQSTRSMAPELRNEVVAMVRCLEERAKENTTLLKANMGAIEQLFEVINTAARKMRRQDVAYSKAGMMCDGYNRNGVSLAYNHTI